MTGNMVFDILLISLFAIIALFLIFFILGKFFGPIKKFNHIIKNIFAGFGRNIRERKEQKRKISEQKRKEEIQQLEEKQQKNMVFISTVKNKLNDLQKAVKELEDKENEILALYEDTKEKILLIDDLHQKPSKFIFNLMNDGKIKKLTGQCDKQKKAIEQLENTINIKKEEILSLIDVLSESIEMEEDETD